MKIIQALVFFGICAISTLSSIVHAESFASTVIPTEKKFEERVRSDQAFRPVDPTLPSTHENALPTLSDQEYNLGLPGDGKSTYTYLRCYYPLANNQASPAPMSYDWAITPSGGYYHLNGYWHSTLAGGMFYTQTPQKDLKNICEYTLLRKGRTRGESIDFFAANSRLSLDYKIWTNDSDTAPLGKINRIIVIGDSLTDDGSNLFQWTQWLIPNRTSWAHGRFSNGPVWVEYVAHSLNLQLSDFAIAGSYLTPGKTPNISTQIDEVRRYTGYAENYQAKNTLMILWAGANDIMDIKGVSEEKIVDVIKADLQSLIKDGVKNILVLNLPNIGLTPHYLGGKYAAGMTESCQKYNQYLSHAVQVISSQYQGDVNLKLFDVDELYKDIHVHTAQYGITNITNACLDLSPKTFSGLGYASYYPRRAACFNPNQFMSWDDMHPTTYVHGLLANKISEFIKASYPL